MIRLIGSRLIIPKGDSGNFSIPTLYSSSENDIAIFSIFDPMYQKTILTKMIPLTFPTLNFSFSSTDTSQLEPKKYRWDIAIYKSPTYDEEGKLTGAEEVHSYFSAYKLPICRIAETTYVPQEEGLCDCKNNFNG